MRILVTGGTGHTGERLVRRLLADGHTVSVFTRRDADDPIAQGLVGAGAALTRGDINAPETLCEALNGKDLLIACTHIRHAEVCIEACRSAGTSRYWQMSSTRGATRYPCRSSREVRAGEQAIRRSGLRATIFRPAMIYGYDRDNNLERVVRWFQRTRLMPLIGDGSNLVQPIFVDDLVDAFASALTRIDQVAGKVFVLAGPDPIPYRKMMSVICEEVRGQRPVFLPIPLSLALAIARTLPPFVTKRTLDAEQIRRFAEDKAASIKKARRILGWSPRDFRKGIRCKLTKQSASACPQSNQDGESS